MKTLKVLTVQIAILLAGLACIELVFRLFMPLPVHGGVYIDRNGDIVHVAQNEFLLRPNLDLTHKSSEFSKRVRTNELGYRKIDNASITPDFLFLGDSFTFGHGVSDEEVFSELFCVKHKFRCQNLGRSGTDTFQQTKILRHALDHYKMRPANVVLVMLAACWLESAGNDLGDNLRDIRAGLSGLHSSVRPRESGDPFLAMEGGHQQKIWIAAFAGMNGGGDLALPETALAATGDTAGLVRTLQRWIGEFEITKRVMLVFSRQVKGALYRCSDDREMAAAVDATKAALAQIERLSAEYGFKVAVAVIHPYQELDGFYAKTEEAVRRATPEAFQLVPTGADFRKDDYYPYDGHFNAAGHANMAAILERNLMGADRK
jgi:hypothetical protein